MGAFSYLCKGNETRKKRMRLDLVQKNMKRFAWIVSPVHIDIRVHIWPVSRYRIYSFYPGGRNEGTEYCGLPKDVFAGELVLGKERCGGRSETISDFNPGLCIPWTCSRKFLSGRVMPTWSLLQTRPHRQTMDSKVPWPVRTFTVTPAPAPVAQETVPPGLVVVSWSAPVALIKWQTPARLEHAQRQARQEKPRARSREKAPGEGFHSET